MNCHVLSVNQSWMLMWSNSLTQVQLRPMGRPLALQGNSQVPKCWKNSKFDKMKKKRVYLSGDWENGGEVVEISRLGLIEPTHTVGRISKYFKPCHLHGFKPPSLVSPPPPPSSSGAAAVMQHADLKSIDLSPSFERDLSPASPLPLLSRGCTGRVCLLAHTLMFFDLLAHMVVNGWRAYQVQGGCPGSFVFRTLSKSLGWSKCLMALVIWLLWHVLWWMVMHCRFYLMVPKLHHRVRRLLGLGV